MWASFRFLFWVRSDRALKIGDALGEFVGLFDLVIHAREKTSIRASIVSSRALTRSSDD
jgi:hypothetical protein